MNTEKAEKALLELAKKEGIDTEEVRREIEIAIAAARVNPDPAAQAFWKAVPHKGEYPTPEEVIIHIAKKIKR